MKITENKRPATDFMFFFDSLLDIFKPTDETLWAFGVRHGTEMLYQFLTKPFYDCPGQALRAAKLHALSNFCVRSHKPHCLAFHPIDRIFKQAEPHIELFGVATDMPCSNFYYYKQDRIELLHELRLNGDAAQKQIKRLTSLDGKRIDGTVSIQKIELDKETHQLLELFTPTDVRD